MLTVDQHTNFSKGILLQGYTAADTTISFIPGGGAKFPNPGAGAYNVTWWNNTDYADPADDPEVEIVRIVAGAGDVKTILRGQEGTAITDKNIPNKTYKMVLSLTQKMIDDIVGQAGTGTFNLATNEGGGFEVYDDTNSTTTHLLFKTLIAGGNIVIVDNGTSLTISATGGGGGGGYDLVQNNGVSVTVRTTLNLSTLLTASDVASKTFITINTTNLANDNTFVTTLAANNTFATALVSNNTFVNALATNSTFINALTSNNTFQSNVNNFVSGGGSGGAGGKPLSFRIVPRDVGASNACSPINGYQDQEALVFKEGTVAASTASLIIIRDPNGFIQERNTALDWATAGQILGYVLRSGFLYLFIVENQAFGTAARVYRYDANDISLGGTQMTIMGGTLLWNAAIAGTAQSMTGNGTDFFFNNDGGNSNNDFDVAKYTLSGTTLTYVATVTLGSAAGYFASSWGVTTDEHYVGLQYGTNNNLLIFDSSAVLTYTSGFMQTHNTIDQKILNWDNTFYYTDNSSGPDYVKLYIPDTTINSIGGGSVVLENMVAGEAIDGAVVSRPVFISAAQDNNVWQGGNAGIGTSNISNDSGQTRFFQRITNGAGININKVGVELFIGNGSPGGNVTVSLYTDNAGIPGVLIGVIETKTVASLVGYPNYTYFANTGQFFLTPSVFHVVMDFTGGTYNLGNYLTMEYTTSGSFPAGNYIGRDAGIDVINTDMNGALFSFFEAGKLYLSDANQTGRNDFDGFVTSTVAYNSTTSMIAKGYVAGFTGLTIGVPYYVSNTIGTIGTSPGSTSIRVGKSLSATALYVDNSM